jgi:hypothetical protein
MTRRAMRAAPRIAADRDRRGPVTQERIGPAQFLPAQFLPPQFPPAFSRLTPERRRAAALQSL